MPRFPFGAACLLAALATSLPGSAPGPKTVSAVEVLGGASMVPLETREGEPLDSVKLQHDVKTLWRSGRYSDVRVESQDAGDAVRVVFRVLPKRLLRLRSVSVTPPTPGVSLQLPPDTEIDEQGAQQIGASVRKQLEEAGHPFAKVEAALEPAGGGRADLLVSIDQGRRIDVADVAITGQLGEARTGARKALKWTGGKTMLPGIPGIWKGWRVIPGYSENAVQYDAANLRSFYFTRGYFDVQVRPQPVDLAAGRTRLAYGVNAGPRYSIRQFGIEGGRGILPKPGRELGMRQVCQALLDERREAGKAGVIDFQARIEVRDAPGASPDARQWVDLKATVQRGPAYRVGRIEFRGKRSFSDAAVRRAMLLDESAPLDELLLRKSLARINDMGFFEPLTQADVIVNTPPGSDRAELTVQLREKKMRHWFLSGPAGPMSLSGPLQAAIGSRLPGWGCGVLDLSTYVVAMNLMLFPKPVGNLIPGFPTRRLFPLLTIQRPPLPGRPLVSGFVISPQLGWRGMLAGYGMSQTRGLLDRLFVSPRAYVAALPVTVAHTGGIEGTMYCEPARTKLDWVRQIGGTASKLVFSFSPL